MTHTLIELQRIDYLPRSKQRTGFSPYTRKELKPITLPFDAMCSDIDAACLNEQRKQGANWFQASNDKDGVWYCGAIF